MEGEVRLESLVKRFGDDVAVDGIDVDMPPGEFFTLVGPSGCGKTTTLRMIAGFERPTSGRILLDGVDVAQTPPHRRNVNTVFQSYALFPHLTVADNVAFGLKYKRLSKAERRKQVGEMLERVRLTGFEARKPDRLSGGQQQRVALARALILRPRVLLLDEPLGALDARLRKELQVELKTLQSEIGMTFVFVTHDQEEALTMSDRIAVMNGGRVEQAGPAAGRLRGAGDAVRGRLPGRVEPDSRRGGWVRRQRLRAHRRRAAAPCRPGRDRGARRGEGDGSARAVRVEPQATDGENRLPGLVEHVVFLGSFRELRVRIVGGALVKVIMPNDGAPHAFEQGAAVTLHLPADSIRVLAPQE